MAFTFRARQWTALLMLGCPWLVAASDALEMLRPRVDSHFVLGREPAEGLRFGLAPRAGEGQPPSSLQIDVSAGPWGLHVASEVVSTAGTWRSVPASARHPSIDYRARRWEVGLSLDDLFGTSVVERAFDDPPHPGHPFVEPPPVEGDPFAPGDARLRVFVTLFF